MKAKPHGLRQATITAAMLLATVGLCWVPTMQAAAQDYVISYSDLLMAADRGKVKVVTVKTVEITGTFVDGRSFTVIMPYKNQVITDLQHRGVSIIAGQP